jgi:hypothetical protein
MSDVTRWFSGFLFLHLLNPKFRGKLQHHREEGLEKDSALYQLMDTRMNGVMNSIVSSDGEYQTILRKSDIYSGELDRMDLSKEIRLLIDRYVSEQNAHSTCAIDPGLGCSPTCWDFPTARPCFWGNTCRQKQKK